MESLVVNRKDISEEGNYNLKENNFVKNDTIQVIPKEVYGDPLAKRTIRVANGGAGPTGVIRAFAESFIHKRSKTSIIDFNISKLS